MTSILYTKAEAFGVRIINAHKYLVSECKEKTISSQLLRSGTSISANVSEAQYAQSRADFISKMSIALKEANESKNWITLLHKSHYLEDNAYNSIIDDVTELIKILTATIITAKKNSK